MAGDQDKRKELLDFLDHKAFDPVLRASPEGYSGQQREMLSDVQRSTENEKQRFHEDYSSARDVKDNYLSDLQSQVAEKKNSELERLDLPRMAQFRDEFLQLCDRLGV